MTLLYSEGYRFNFNDNEVVKTGGLSFEVKPQTRARISLNGEFKKKVSGWTYSAYLNALSPGNYQVELERKGFHPWQKNLRVKKGKVTEAKHVLMVPKETELSATKKADSFSFSPDENKLAFRQNQQLQVLNLEEEATKQVQKPTSNIITWGPESERFLINASGTHFVINDQENYEVNLPSNYQKVKFNPDQPTELFYEKDSKLLKKDYTDKEKATTTIIDYLAFDLTSQGITWLSSEGNIYQSDFTGEVQATLNSEPLSVEEENYQITKTAEKVLILKDETLHVLTKEGVFKQLASGVKELKLSPHHQKVALNSEHEINVLYLNEQYGQPQREKFDKDFISRFSQPLEKVTWFDSHHLIFNLKDSNKIKISEVDTRSQINMEDYLDTNFERWYWNNNQETIYLLKDNTIYQNSPLEI